MAHRQVIRTNLETLSDLTSCSDRFLDRCFQDKILTVADKEKLEIIKTRYARCSAFYDILTLKEENKFLQVLDIMNQDDYRQSSDVLNILRSYRTFVVEIPTPTQQPQNPIGNNTVSTKEIQGKDVHWIATYLSSMEETAEKKEIIYRLLNLPNGELIDLKRKAKDSGIETYTFFTGCIHKSISLNVGFNYSQLNELLFNDFPTIMNKIVNDPKAK